MRSRDAEGPPRAGLARPRKLAVFMCHALMDIQHSELGVAFNMSRVAALKATHDAHWKRQRDRAFAGMVGDVMTRIGEQLEASPAA